MPSISFPKIAVVHGAETQLGEHLVAELIHSTDIDCVHAITSTVSNVLKRLHTSYRAKIEIHVATLDKLETIFRSIPECDLAFCCLSTSRHAQNEIGSHRFRSINYEIPRRFVLKAFDLGVLHVSLLSHAHADPTSRTEFFKLRGDLERDVRRIRKEAGDHSPYISVLKVTSVSSKPQTISAGMSSRPSYERITDRISTKLVGDSRHPIHVSELAVAMRVDALLKADKQFESLESDYRRGGHKFTELDTNDILQLYQDEKIVESRKRGQGANASRY